MGFAEHSFVKDFIIILVFYEFYKIWRKNDALLYMPQDVYCKISSLQFIRVSKSTLIKKQAYTRF